MIVVVLVMIRNEGSILLVHQRRAGCWSLPGGKMEPGESFDQAATRETREETGLDVRLGRVVGLYSQPADDELIITVEAEVIGGAWHHETDEITDCTYFPMTQLPAEIRHQLRQRIDDFRRGDLAVIARTQ